MFFTTIKLSIISRRNIAIQANLFNLEEPPKVSISSLMGMLKGKTAIKIFKSYPALKKKPYLGNHFGARGYCSSTIGLDEEMLRTYVKYQEEQEKKEEAQQLNFDFSNKQD